MRWECVDACFRQMCSLMVISLGAVVGDVGESIAVLVDGDDDSEDAIWTSWKEMSNIRFVQQQLVDDVIIDPVLPLIESAMVQILISSMASCSVSFRHHHRQRKFLWRWKMLS